jgi:TonB family protein
MKTVLSRFSVLFFLAIVSQAMAAFESAKFDSDNVSPGFPLSLISDGVIEGQVMFVINISAEGKITDSLVLAYTHKQLVKPSLEAMKEWKIKPARLDGTDVPVQLELKLNFKREGVVETNTMNITNHFLFDGFQSGKYRLAYRVQRLGEIDRVPEPLSIVNPTYSRSAEKQGVRGKVEVFFYIDEKGEVRLPSITASADPYLSELAVTALRSWHFAPPTRHGQPVLVAASQVFVFGGKE